MTRLAVSQGVRFIGVTLRLRLRVRWSVWKVGRVSVQVMVAPGLILDIHARQYLAYRVHGPAIPIRVRVRVRARVRKL